MYASNDIKTTVNMELEKKINFLLMTDGGGGGQEDRGDGEKGRE